MGSDLELVRRVCDQDGDALDKLFARHSLPVRARLVRMVRDEGIAEDLTQEVFLRLWTRAEQWEGRGALGAWLMRIATNLALNHFRAAGAASGTFGRVPGEGRGRGRPQGWETEKAGQWGLVPGWLEDTSAVEPGERLDRTERGQRLRELVAQLPEEKREVLRLVYDEEMDVREVAERLGIPAGTVKSRLHHARAQLARQWGKLGDRSED